MIWSISWKNVWRNKIRSLVVIIATTLGIISGVMVVAIMEGWTKQRLHDAIYNEVSHIQIHNSEYIKNEEILLTVRDTAGLIRALNNLPEINGWVERTRMVAMVNTPWANTGVIIYGIDPEKEKKITEIYKKIVPGGGEYLDNQKPGSILISDKTAEILKLKQYIITQEILDKLKADNVPDETLLVLSRLTGTRYRSPKDFSEALRAELSKREFEKYSFKISEYSLDYRIRSKIQITLSDEKGNPVQGTFRV